MSETATGAASAKKSATSKNPAKKARSTPNHPKVSDMVNAAIANLKERGGSSLQAIKKYIGANYSVDVEKIAPFIRKYLKTAVSNGTLIQTKGKGASGSFKLGTVSKKSEKEVAIKKPKPEKKVKSPTKAKEAKKVTKTKPKSSPTKAAPSNKKSAVKPPKSPKKASKEKVKKTPTKAKAPKPKKAASKAPKSTAPKQETTASAQD